MNQSISKQTVDIYRARIDAFLRDKFTELWSSKKNAQPDDAGKLKLELNDSNKMTVFL